MEYLNPQVWFNKVPNNLKGTGYIILHFYKIYKALSLSGFFVEIFLKIVYTTMVGETSQIYAALITVFSPTNALGIYKFFRLQDGHPLGRGVKQNYIFQKN